MNNRLATRNMVTTTRNSRDDNDDDKQNTDASSVNDETTEEESDEVVVQKTRQWLEQVVIGLNLCPFAERPLLDGKLKIEVQRGLNLQDEILPLIFAELLIRREKPGTTLVVCPECHPHDFEAYLDVVSTIEDIFEEHEDDLVGSVQVAPFHPLFQFQGNDKDEIDNWTNRSPYPLFHILREDEVTRAVEKLRGDSSKVWMRNVNLLEALHESIGVDGVERVMKGMGTDEDTEATRAILKSVSAES